MMLRRFAVIKGPISRRQVLQVGSFALLAPLVPQFLAARPAAAGAIGARGVADILLRTRGEELGRQIGTLETELAAYRGSETPRDDMTLVAFRPKRQT
jgi:hypothetical protein